MVVPPTGEKSRENVAEKEIGSDRDREMGGDGLVSQSSVAV